MEQAENKEVFNNEKNNFQKDLSNFFFSNTFIVIVLFLAIVIRLIVFSKTLDQTLWWDEAEYASLAVHWATGAPTWIAPFREVAMPFLWSLLYKINPSEYLWRITELLFSIALVFTTYFTAKIFYNKKVALIATIFISFNALILFYSGRLLTYGLAPLFIALTVYYFAKGHIYKKGNKNLVYAGMAFSAGFILYWSTFLAAPIILFYLIFTERFAWLKNRKLIKYFLIGLIPLFIYFIFSYLSVGAIHPRFIQVSDVGGSETPITPTNFFSYLGLFPHLFGWIWVILFVIGLFSIYELFLSSDKILGGKTPQNQRSNLMIFLWFLFTYVFFAAVYSFGKSDIWETFLFPLFPAFGIIASLGTVFAYNLISKSLGKEIAIILLVLVLVFAAYSEASRGMNLINNKLSSFDELKQAGYWLRVNSPSDAIVLTGSPPQMAYYSQRESIAPSETQQEFLEQLKNLSPNFLVLSIYAQSPQFLYEIPDQNPEIFSVAKVYTDSSTRPRVIIYQINQSHLNTI